MRRGDGVRRRVHGRVIVDRIGQAAEDDQPVDAVEGRRFGRRQPDVEVAAEIAQRLLEEGIYAIGFFYPVVPQGKARIRTQISAAHTRDHLDRAIDAFVRIGRELGVIKG